MRMNRNDCDAATSPPASHVNERDIHLLNSECERDKLRRVVLEVEPAACEQSGVPSSEGFVLLTHKLRLSGS